MALNDATPTDDVLAQRDIGLASQLIGTLYDSMVRSIEFEVNHLNFVHSFVNMNK